MKKVLSAIFSAVVFCVITSGLALACPSELRQQIKDAEASLIEMSADITKRGYEQQTLVIDTADKVTEALFRLKAPAGKEAQFKELVDAWMEYKKAREEKIVPFVLRQGVPVNVSLIHKYKVAKVMELCEGIFP